MSNTFSSNCWGVILYATTDATIYDNTFKNDIIVGIMANSGSTRTIILKNTFTSEALALQLNGGSTTAVITGNTVFAVGLGDLRKVGININGSNGNRIYDNIFATYNNVQATDTANIWCLPSPIARINIVGGPSVGGNAWMIPNGLGFSQIQHDDNGDGFVDGKTFMINNSNQDFLPLKV